MESQPQNPKFRNNPENFHPWGQYMRFWYLFHSIGKQSSPRQAYEYGQSHQSLRCLNTQKMEDDEGSDQKSYVHLGAILPLPPPLHEAKK